MHLHEAGEEIPAGEIDNPGAPRDGDLGAAPNGGDPAILDHDRGVGERRPVGRVDQRRAAEDQGRGLSRGGGD